MGVVMSVSVLFESRTTGEVQVRAGMAELRQRVSMVGLVVLLLLGLLGGVPTPANAATVGGGWTQPLDSYRASAGWLASGCPGSSAYPVPGKFHLGVDMAAGLNTPVRSLGAGSVLKVWPHASWGTTNGVSNAGLWVKYVAADGTEFTAVYGHIQVASGIVQGSAVSVGQVIGKIGSWSGGEHLHLGIRPGTSIPSSGWGTGTCPISSNTNGFVDPWAFLAAHPMKSPRADINRDGRVDVFDLSILLSDWGTSNPRSSLNGDTVVNVFDLSILLAAWGPVPRAAAAVMAAAPARAVPADGGESSKLLPAGPGDAEVVARAATGELFGNSAAVAGGNPVAAVWASDASQASRISVPGMREPVLVDANTAGLAVGAGSVDDGKQMAWYRTPGGETGVLDADGADRAFALSVGDDGRIAGYVFKGAALPVVWNTPSSAPQYLPLPAGVEAASVTAMNGNGVAAGALVDDRLAVWSKGRVDAPIADGEAIDVNAGGAILFGSASNNTSPPRVRRADGGVHSLADLQGYEGQSQMASALNEAGEAGGSQGPRPVVWRNEGTAAQALELPAGASAGRVLGLTDDGRALGWIDAGGARRAAIWDVPEEPSDSTTARLVPVAPTRVMDTRSGVGVTAGARAPGSVVTLPVSGRGPVPATASAVVLNVTITQSAGPGYVQVFPTGRSALGASSNLNVERAGQTIPNLVTVPVGDSGQVSFHAQAGGHLIADVFAYYESSTASASGRLTPLSPRRILDTRDPARGVPKPAAGSATRVQVLGAGGVPATGVSAVVLNVTATQADGPGYVQVVPTGGPTPYQASSNLNLERTGQTIPNLVIVPVGAGGAIDLFTSSGSHLIADVFGYFTDGSAAVSTEGLFVPKPPARVLDTRDPSDGTPKLTAGQQLSFQPLGKGGVPTSGVSAVLYNATVTQTAGGGYLQVFPTGQGTPGASSNLNFTSGQTIPNAVITATGLQGRTTVFASQSTHLILDVAGYYTR